MQVIYSIKQGEIRRKYPSGHTGESTRLRGPTNKTKSTRNGANHHWSTWGPTWQRTRRRTTREAVPPGRPNHWFGRTRAEPFPPMPPRVTFHHLNMGGCVWSVGVIHSHHLNQGGCTYLAEDTHTKPTYLSFRAHMSVTRQSRRLEEPSVVRPTLAWLPWSSAST